MATKKKNTKKERTTKKDRTPQWARTLDEAKAVSAKTMGVRKRLFRMSMYDVERENGSGGDYYASFTLALSPQEALKLAEDVTKVAAPYGPTVQV